MILMGYSCPSCGSDVLDSIDHCYHCLKPYEGTLKAVAQSHHEAKLVMVAKNTMTPLDAVTRLGAVSQGIAATQKAGRGVGDGIIPELFQAISDE